MSDCFSAHSFYILYQLVWPISVQRILTNHHGGTAAEKPNLLQRQKVKNRETRCWLLVGLGLHSGFLDVDEYREEILMNETSIFTSRHFPQALKFTLHCKCRSCSSEESKTNVLSSSSSLVLPQWHTQTQRLFRERERDKCVPARLTVMGSFIIHSLVSTQPKQLYIIQQSPLPLFCLRKTNFVFTKKGKTSAHQTD